MQIMLLNVWNVCFFSTSYISSQKLNRAWRMKRAGSSDNEEGDKVGLLDELYEEFVCGVCCELMVLPTTLNCGHSFCRHCLAHWFRVGEKAECPSCRQVSAKCLLWYFNIAQLMSFHQTYFRDSSRFCWTVPWNDCPLNQSLCIIYVRLSLVAINIFCILSELFIFMNVLYNIIIYRISDRSLFVLVYRLY